MKTPKLPERATRAKWNELGYVTVGPATTVHRFNHDQINLWDAAHVQRVSHSPIHDNTPPSAWPGRPAQRVP